MRNLKKVLSLALALVMLVGMMVVGAGAAVTLDDLTDKDAINENYREAVDLLTAIEVLAGTDQGNFNPSGNLTRDQAAKIVATLALGVDAANALNTAVAPFTDVPATSWSAGYVAYCANMGIVNGIGNGKFSPGGQVSGYQFAKMLLGVLGYGAKDEYVGSNWILNVSRDAQTVGVSDGVTITNAALTREEAAQMAYNTIQLDLVSYSELIGTYTKYAWNVSGSADGQTLLGTLADNIFNVKTNTEQDEYGYLYEYWHYKNRAAAITDTYLAVDVLGTVSGGATAGSIVRSYTLADRLTIWENGRPIEANAAAYTNYRLGTFDLVPYTASGGGATKYWSSAGMRGSDAKVTPYAGQIITLVDAYDENNRLRPDGVVDTLIIVTSYLAEVTRVNAATSSADRSVEVNVFAPTTDGKPFTAKFETEDFAKGDYVLVDPKVILNDNNSSITSGIIDNKGKDLNGTAILGYAAPQVVSAVTVNAYYLNNNCKADGSVTANGTKYNYNGVFATYYLKGDTDATSVLTAGFTPGDAPASHNNVAALGAEIASNRYGLNRGTYDLYLDQLGNVIGVKVAEDTVSDFAYILEVGESAFEKFNTVRVALSDGTVGTYTVSSRSHADAYDNGQASNAFCAVGQIYSYTIESNGEINLQRVQDVNSLYKVKVSTESNAGKGTNGQVGDVNNAGSFTKGTTTIDVNGTIVYGGDSTVYLYVNQTNGNVTRYVGKNNAPSVKDTDSTNLSVAYHEAKAGSTTYYADLVVVWDAPETELGNNYVYITSSTSIGHAKPGDNELYFYDAIKDGKKVVIATYSTSLAVGVYKYSYDEGAYDGTHIAGSEIGVYDLGDGVAEGNPSPTETYVRVDFAVSDAANGSIMTPAGDAKLGVKEIVLGNANVTEVINGKVKTEETVAKGDTVTVVFEKVGNTYVAKDVYITAHAEEVETIGAGTLGSQGDTIDTNTSVTGNVELAAGKNIVVESGAKLTITGDLTVKDAAGVTVNGTGELVVTGALVYETTSAVTLAGNIKAAGLTTAGDTTISGDVTSTGNIRIGGTANIAENAGLTNEGDITITGTATIAGELENEGDIIFTDAAAVTGTITNTGDLTFEAASPAVGGTITNEGTVLFEETVTVTGTITNTGAMTFTKAATIEGDVSTTGDLTVKEASTVATGKTLTTTGAAILEAAVTGEGKLTVANFGETTPENSSKYAQTKTVEVTGSVSVAALEAIGGDTLTADHILILGADSSDEAATANTWFTLAGTSDNAGTSLAENAKVTAGTWTASTCYYEDDNNSVQEKVAWLKPTTPVEPDQGGGGGT